MSRSELLLSNQLCFLVHRLDLEIGARYRPLLSKLGLTYSQYLAMLVLWEKRRAGIGELCEALALDTGTVSPLIKRLERSGLVVRERGKEDERAVTVSLTPAGAALEGEARSVPRALVGCIGGTEAEFAEMRKVLESMLDRLTACRVDLPPRSSRGARG